MQNNITPRGYRLVRLGEKIPRFFYYRSKYKPMSRFLNEWFFYDTMSDNNQRYSRRHDNYILIEK